MILRILGALSLLMCVVGPVSAQGTWSEHTRAGEWAFSRGDPVRAEVEFRAALDLAASFPEDDPRLESSLSNLARLYEHEMRMDEAQSLYQLLLAAMEHRLGRDAAGLLDPLVAVARTSVAIGDVPTAEESLSRYREIAQATGAADPAQQWRAMAMYSRMLGRRDEVESALELQRDAVTAQQSDPDATELERASELETLAQMEIQYGSSAGVEEMLDRVVDLRADDGVDDATVVYSEASETALGSGELELADRLASKALESVGEGETPPITAYHVLADASWLPIRRGSSTLADLAMVEADPAALDEAASRHEVLLDVENAELAENDPRRIETLGRLAAIDTMRGDLDGAIRWQRQFVAAVRDEGGARALQAEDGLAFLLTEEGRWDEALEVNGPLLVELEASWGSDDPRLAPVLERQVLLLTELGRKKEAKAARKRLRKMTG